MTSPLLLEHFDELIATPEDVEKLHRSILQLAMQGKLVDQENGKWTEEDVKNTLAKEIQGFIDAGKMTKPSKILPITKKDIPEDKPENWLSIHLGECLGLVNGRAYKQSELLDSGTPVIRIQNLNGSERWYYSELELSPEKYCYTNDLLFAWSASFGPYIWEGDRAIYHYHIWKIELTSYLDKKFAYYLLKYLTEQIRDASHGLAMLHITKEKMENWVIALPPLSEQEHIVTRLEGLFAQTRRLAEELANSRRELDRLNESALARLLASETPEEFNEHWGFIAEHFDLLTSAPEHIAPLRQSILELAVRGKLTRREAGDESAGELLKRSREKKAKTGKEKPVSPVKEIEKPFELPDGWEWVKLGEIGNAVNFPIVDGPFGTAIDTKADYINSGVPVVRMMNVKPYKFIPENMKYVSQEKYETLMRHNVLPGDVLFSKVGAGIGEACLVPQDFGHGMLSTTGVTRFRVGEIVLPEYLNHFLNSHKEEFVDMASKTAQPFLNMGMIKNVLFPLPPFAEQERIVKRVEQLLSLCDALEAQLMSAEEERGRLVESVLAGVGGRDGEEKT